MARLRRLLLMFAGCAALFAAASCANNPQNQENMLLSVDTTDYAQVANRTDFRKESIYFVITPRFYDGDPTTNVHCWDDAQAKNPDSDPAWRGDFKGLIEKLDYIKALGFTAIWVTPPVKNASGYDYHGYHAINFKEIDPRYKTSDVASAEEAYQKFITAAHAKGIKVIQDIVFNHSSNFGEENLYPMFKRNAPSGLNDTIASLSKYDPNSKLPSTYDTLAASAQYSARITAMKSDTTDTARIFHHEQSLSWESYTVQTGQIAGDCVDLNTENPTVYNYLTEAAKKYIDMGIDGFRVDTVKHISRLTFNKTIVPSLKSYAGDNLFIFGEVCSRYRNVWNSGIPAISAPFFTWKESKTYSWSSTDRTVNEASVLSNWNDNSTTTGQPTSTNAYLSGVTYHTPDWSKRSGMDVIDFPMHWSFCSARDAFGMGVGSDSAYNDATWNVTYVDSHDYAPDTAPENQRFNQPTDTWAENLDLMFTFRGIPCLFYGSEIEFMKGAPIDVGPNAPLSTTGRAYFGDKITGSVTVSDFAKYSGATGNMATTLAHPLSLHVQRLNLIRRTIPALQMGQYTTSGVSGDGMAFIRRYTSGTTDSLACVTISGSATFTGLPNGTYVDAITGGSISVTGGSLTASCSGKGNMRIYVLNGPGQIGSATSWLSGTTPNPTPTTTFKVHFKKNTVANWSTFNCYYWGSNGSPTSNTWPGSAMSSEGNNWYYFNVSGTSASIIFNSGSAQTVDLSQSKEAWFVPGGTDSTGKITGTWYTANPDSTGTAPAEPASVTVSGATASSLAVSWAASTGATSYEIYKSTNAGGPYESVGTSTSTSLTASGLTASTKYYFVVTAANSYGTSTYSPEGSGTTSAPVAGLKVHFKVNSVANWTTVNCYYWGSTGSPASNTWPGAAATFEGNSWYVFTIPSSTSASVIFNNGSVQTVDLSRTAEGWFVPSGTSSSKITGTWYSSNPDSAVTVPSAPTGLAVSADSSTGLTVSWSAASGATSYSVEMSTSSTGTYTSAGTNITGTKIDVTDLTPATTYYFRVMSVNSAGTSAASSVVSGKTSAASTSLKVHMLVNSYANWTTPYVYYWGSNGTAATNGWPGERMTSEGSNWWVFTITGATSSNVIFNTGSSSGQTVDLSRTGEGWFKPTGTSNGKVTGTWYSSKP